MNMIINFVVLLRARVAICLLNTHTRFEVAFSSFNFVMQGRRQYDIVGVCVLFFFLLFSTGVNL